MYRNTRFIISEIRGGENVPILSVSPFAGAYGDNRSRLINNITTGHRGNRVRNIIIKSEPIYSLIMFFDSGNPNEFAKSTNENE